MPACGDAAGVAIAANTNNATAIAIGTGFNPNCAEKPKITGINTTAIPALLPILVNTRASVSIAATKPNSPKPPKIGFKVCIKKAVIPVLAFVKVFAL